MVDHPIWLDDRYKSGEARLHSFDACFHRLAVGLAELLLADDHLIRTAGATTPVNLSTAGVRSASTLGQPGTGHHLTGVYPGLPGRTHGRKIRVRPEPT